MYAEVNSIQDSIPVFEVEQNGKRLRGEDYSPEQWDKIILPLQYFAELKTSNRLYSTDIKRLTRKMFIPTNDANFLITCDYHGFEKWYRNYLEEITGKQTNSLKVYYRLYRFNLNKLEPTSSVTPLSKLCR